MSRAIDGTKRLNRRKKILKLAKGFRGRRGTNFKAAKDAISRKKNWHKIIIKNDFFYGTI